LRTSGWCFGSRNEWVLASQRAVHTLVVVEPVVRYLHLLAWLTLLLVAVLLQSLVRRAHGADRLIEA
jgi:hypothetical protein